MAIATDSGWVVSPQKTRGRTATNRAGAKLALRGLAVLHPRLHPCQRTIERFGPAIVGTPPAPDAFVLFGKPPAV